MKKLINPSMWCEIRKVTLQASWFALIMDVPLNMREWIINNAFVISEPGILDILARISNRLCKNMTKKIVKSYCGSRIGLVVVNLGIQIVRKCISIREWSLLSSRRTALTRKVKNFRKNSRKIYPQCGRHNWRNYMSWVKIR